MALPSIGHEFLVVSDPELRFTPGGDAVCNFRVKASSRKEEPKGSGNWVDKDVLWASVTAWRDLAEHVVESIVNKDMVVVVGTIHTREYESNGVKQKSVEITAESVGPSLKFRTTPHGAAAAQGAPQGQGQPQGQPQYAQPQQGQPQYQQPYAQPQGQPQYAAPQGQPQGQPQYQQPAPGQQPYQQQPPATDPWGNPAPAQGVPPF